MWVGLWAKEKTVRVDGLAIAEEDPITVSPIPGQPDGPPQQWPQSRTGSLHLLLRGLRILPLCKIPGLECSLLNRVFGDYDQSWGVKCANYHKSGTLVLGR
jgi:hypothetical protein